MGCKWHNVIYHWKGIMLIKIGVEKRTFNLNSFISEVIEQRQKAQIYFCSQKHHEPAQFHLLKCFLCHSPSKMFIPYRAVLVVTKMLLCINHFLLTFGKLILSKNQLVSCQEKVHIICSQRLVDRAVLKHPWQTLIT